MLKCITLKLTVVVIYLRFIVPSVTVLSAFDHIGLVHKARRKRRMAAAQAKASALTTIGSFGAWGGAGIAADRLVALTRQ